MSCSVASKCSVPLCSIGAMVLAIVALAGTPLGPRGGGDASVPDAGWTPMGGAIMRGQHEVRLTSGERHFLNSVILRGQCSVSMLTRAHILLAADAATAGEPRSDDDVAQLALTSPATVYRVRKRFAKRGLPWALYANGRRPRRGLLPQLDA